MREIKFRAIDIDEPSTWRYGYYYKHEEITLAALWESEEAAQKAILENTKHYIVWDGWADWNMKNPHYRAEVNGDTVGQYTGLKDRNGTEIYKGDIMLGDWMMPQPFEVKYGLQEYADDSYQEYGYGWNLRVEPHPKKGDIFPGKVIGNIYKQPELLGVAK